MTVELDTQMQKSKLAHWTHELQESEIRRLLRYQPKYYFAGGLPGNQPTGAMNKIIREIADELPLDPISRSPVLNYGPTEGIKELREVLSKRLVSKDKVSLPQGYKDVIISTGSQQTLYGLLKVMINPEDIILTSRPTYLGFLGVAKSLGAKILTLPADESGILPEGIEQACKLSSRLFSRVPKILYVQSYSENPTGISLADNRKEKIYNICREYGVFIIEDVAYKEIQFQENQEPFLPIKKFDKENEMVAYLGTSSKEAAVLRIGYSVMPDQIRDEFIKLKGFMDLCTPSITQIIAKTYYERYIDTILPQITDRYLKQFRSMAKALDEFMPGTRTNPTGGFFVWHTVPGYNTSKNLEKALKNEVLYVPGAAFYPTEYSLDRSLSTISRSIVKYDSMRLSFSANDEEIIFEGIKQLAKCFE